MIKIRVAKTEKMTIFTQLICVSIILLAYIFSKNLMYLSGFIGLIFILSPIKIEQKFSLMFFLLPFTVIFTISKEKTSIFMFLRLAMIFSGLTTIKFKINKFFLYIGLILLSTWCMCISSVFGTLYYVRLFNIILWMLIGFIMQISLTSDTISPVSNSLCNGTILSSIIGMNLKFIPNLEKEINSFSNIGYSGSKYSRFIGLWNDPNMFTVFICMSLWVLFMEYDKKRISLTTFMIKSLIITFFGVITMSKSCILLIIIFWLYVIISKSSIGIIPKFMICLVVCCAALYFLSVNTDWLENVLYRFRGGKQRADINSITTNRSLIWKMYFDSLNNRGTWLFGNGLNCVTPGFRAAHNTLLQCIYNLGILGLIIYVLSFIGMFKQTPINLKIDSKKYFHGTMALTSILLTLLFLDGMFLELFYYMFPLTFIYIKNYKQNSGILINDKQPV